MRTPGIPSASLLRNHLGIDKRALAAFRFLIGFCIMLSLIQRAGYIAVHYTDRGIYPTSLLKQEYPLFATLSIFARIDDPVIQSVLFVIAGLLALLVMLGIATKPALLGSYIIILSLYARNPYMVSSKELILSIFILLAFFLPINHKWTLYSGPEEDTDTYFGAASAILLIQYVYVLFSNSVWKLKGTTWPNGTAMHYVLHLDQYTYLLGDYLAEISFLHTPLTYTWLFLLLISPLLILTKKWLRAALVTIYIAAFIGMALTIDVWMYPVILITGIIVFYPSSMWDSIESSSALQYLSGMTTIDNHENHGLLKKRIPDRFIHNWETATKASLILVIVLLLFINMPFLTSYIPTENAQGSQTDRWKMFAPNPSQHQLWFDVEVETESGTVIEGVTLEEFNYPPISDLNDLFPHPGWRMYMIRMASNDDRSMAFAEAMCHRVSRSTEFVPVTSSITINRMHIKPDGGYAPKQRTDLAETRC